jgi:hypothetical protein
MYRSSVGVFAQFLAGLLDLLDRAEAHAVARKIRSLDFASYAALPQHVRSHATGGRSYQTCGSGVRAAGRSGAADLPGSEPDISELKARITTAINFIRSPAAGADQRCR